MRAKDFSPISSKELKQIINEQLSQKVTNMYNLLFWDYDKNDFYIRKRSKRMA